MTLKEEIKWLDGYIKKLVKEGVEVIVLRSILTRLKRQDKKEPPSAYHSEAIGLYKMWLEHHGLPAIVDARQGNAMKEILSKLKAASKDKTEESAFQSFQAILHHWPRVGAYLEKRKQLTDINAKLVEIIDKIKHGATKQSSNIMEADKVHAELAKKYRGGYGTNG